VRETLLEPHDWSATWRHLQTQGSNEQSHTGGGDSREGYERLDSNDISEVAGCRQDAATAGDPIGTGVAGLAQG